MIFFSNVDHILINFGFCVNFRGKVNEAWSLLLFSKRVEREELTLLGKIGGGLFSFSVNQLIKKKKKKKVKPHKA